MENLCRTCMASSEQASSFISVFEKALICKNEEMVSVLLEKHCSIKIDESDFLPKRICIECFKELQSSIQFRLKCAQTELRLYEILKRTNDQKIEAPEEQDILLKRNISEEHRIAQIPEDFAESCKKESEGSNPDIFPLSVDQRITMKAVSPERTPFQQPPDDESFETVYKAIEVQSYPCCICTATFYSKDSLDEHATTLHDLLIVDKDIGDPICHICNHKFDTLAELDFHQMPTDENRYCCVYCEADYASAEEVLAHFQQLHSIKVEENAVDITQPSELDEPGSTDESAATSNEHAKFQYICEICSRVCRNYDALRSHKKVHSAERTHKCSYCPRAFADKKSKKRHEMIHTGEKPFSCSFCDKRFITSHHQKFHEATNHSGIPRRYTCDFCDRTFCNKEGKEYHEKHGIHTEKLNLEQGFDCLYCDRKFNDELTRNGHQQSHAESMNQKRYTCQHCDMFYSFHSNLKRHMLRCHKESCIPEYQCKYCDKAYTSAASRNQHQMYHLRKKPLPKRVKLSCQYCSKWFLNISTFNRHERSHKKKQLAAA